MPLSDLKGGVSSDSDLVLQLKNIAGEAKVPLVLTFSVPKNHEDPSSRPILDDPFRDFEQVSDKILRFLTVRVDEDFRKASRTAEKRKAESQRRNLTKGLPGEAVKALDPSGQAVSEDTNRSVDPEGKVE